MHEFGREGRFEISSADLSRANQLFAAHRLSDEETSKEISRVYEETGEIMDPHSVIGVAAARMHGQSGIPTIVLGTAHPAKFAEAVTTATGVQVELPPAARKIMQGEEKVQKISNDLEQVQRLIDFGSVAG